MSNFWISRFTRFFLAPPGPADFCLAPPRRTKALSHPSLVSRTPPIIFHFVGISFLPSCTMCYVTSAVKIECMLSKYKFHSMNKHFHFQNNTFTFSCSPQCSPGFPSPPPCSISPSSSSPRPTPARTRRADRTTNNPTTSRGARTTSRELFTLAESSPQRQPHTRLQWRLR